MDSATLIGAIGIEGTIELDHYISTYSGGMTVVKFLAAFKKTGNGSSGNVSTISSVNAGDVSPTVSFAWSGDTLQCTVSVPSFPFRLTAVSQLKLFVSKFVDNINETPGQGWITTVDVLTYADF